MLAVTVPAIEGRPVQWYLGIVSGEAMAAIGQLLGVGPRAYAGGDDACHASASALDVRDARDTAIFEMLREAAERGANAVIGVGLGYASIPCGSGATALMVTASGTAVRV